MGILATGLLSLAAVFIDGAQPAERLVGQPHRARESARSGRERPHGARHARHHLVPDSQRRTATAARRAAACSSPARSRCARPAPTAWSTPPTTATSRRRCGPAPDNILGSADDVATPLDTLHADRSRSANIVDQRRAEPEPAPAVRSRIGVSGRRRQPADVHADDLHLVRFPEAGPWMRHARRRAVARRRSRRERGFTLVELLVTMAITTIILGATMVAMNDAIKATESASSDHRHEQRAAHGDGPDGARHAAGRPGPAGRPRRSCVPYGASSAPMQLPGPVGSNFQLDGPSFCPPERRDPDTVCEQITAVVPGPGRGPEIVDGQPTDMITIVAADSAFDQVPLTAFAANGASITVALPTVRPSPEFTARHQHHQRRRRRHRSRRPDHADQGQRQRARAGHAAVVQPAGVLRRRRFAEPESGGGGATAPPAMAARIARAPVDTRAVPAAAA